MTGSSVLATAGRRRDRLRDLASRSAAEVSVLAILPRIFAASTTALICGFWIGPLAALAWLGAILLHEGLLVPLLVRWLITPNAKTRPGLATGMMIFLSLLGSTLYTLGWAAAWVTGGQSFSLFGGMIVGCTLVHGLTYLSRSALTVALGIGPALIAVLAVAFLTPAIGVAPWLVMLCVAQALVIVAVSVRDRAALLRSLVDQRAARKAAEEASKTKSQFLATVSHELRTPLNAIIGYSELIEEEHRGIGAPTLLEDSRRIQRAARHLLGLINDILDHAKGEAGKIELSHTPTQLPDIFADVVEAVRAAAAKNGNELIASCAPTMGLALVDPLRLKQCMLNLASNAVKFTANGRVALTLGQTVEAGVAMIRFEATDTGIGMSEEVQARLFKPFVQANSSVTRDYGGTGLGLAITRQLAEAMGGHVSVKSAPGQGSTFTLMIPRGPAIEARDAYQASA